MHRYFMAIALICLTSAAGAGQRLVGAGDDWSGFDATSVTAGDEIVLMPGRHRPGLLRGLSGTPAKPIVIRSLAPDRPAIIEADREGLHLEGVQHIVLRDLTVEGATITGISITPPAEYDVGAEPWQADIRILNVTVRRTGPTGKRHGIQLSRVGEVRIERCKIEGWGGAGVDVTACRDVQVAHCMFRGLDDHSQRSAVHVRGGSRKVRITDCELHEAGLYPLLIGGQDDPLLTATGEIVEDDVVASGTPDAPSHQAADVTVLRCVIRGGGYPLYFSSAADCRVRNLTIVDPEHGVIAIDLAAADEPMVPSSGLSFGQSLVVWRPGEIDRLFRLGPHGAADAITLEANLWWSPPAETGVDPFGWPSEPVAPQLVDVDPALDEKLAPKTARAALFGAYAP